MISSPFFETGLKKRSQRTVISAVTLPSFCFDKSLSNLPQTTYKTFSPSIHHIDTPASVTITHEMLFCKSQFDFFIISGIGSRVSGRKPKIKKNALLPKSVVFYWVTKIFRKYLFFTCPCLEQSQEKKKQN
jgi:hypothetical protein